MKQIRAFETIAVAALIERSAKGPRLGKKNRRDRGTGGQGGRWRSRGYTRPPEENSIHGHFDVSSRRVVRYPPIRHSLHQVDTVVFVRAARLHRSPFPLVPRHRRRRPPLPPSSFTSAQSRQFYPVACIVSRSLSLSLVYVYRDRDGRRARPQTRTYVRGAAGNNS